MAIEIIQHNENCFEKKESQTVIKLTLEELIEAKVSEIKLQCKYKIEAGFDSDVKYGEMKHYTLKDLDQKYLDKLAFSIASMGIEYGSWHYDKQILCDIWSKEDFMKFYKQAQEFILKQTYKSDALELWIRSEALTYEEIESINMDSILPAKYIDILKERLTQMGVTYE